VTAVDDMRRFGSVQFDEHGFVRGFREKDPTVRRDGAGLINAGVYIVSRALIESIPPGRSVSLESEIFPLCLDGRLRMWKASGPFIDIGTPESFADAAGFFARSLA
jgi:NDP-sugar pyrophosphorylase family protein